MPEPSKKVDAEKYKEAMSGATLNHAPIPLHKSTGKYRGEEEKPAEEQK